MRTKCTNNDINKTNDFKFLKQNIHWSYSAYSCEAITGWVELNIL